MLKIEQYRNMVCLVEEEYLILCNDYILLGVKRGCC